MLNTINPFQLDLYVDADVCGLFNQEDPRDRNSVKSRAGFLIRLGGWPILWKTSLMQHVCQSTLEAEYSALSIASRTFLPIKWLIQEMISHMNGTKLEAINLNATVFEDDQSTCILAKTQRITNRTEHLLSKWHWFWDKCNENEFEIVKCPSKLMMADYLTKPLVKSLFEDNRKLVQGW